MSSQHSTYEGEEDVGDREGGRFGARRRKVNPLAEAKIETVSYRDVNVLKYFVSERGRLIPRRMTGVSAKQQRQIAKSVKQARLIGLLPYVRYEG